MGFTDEDTILEMLKATDGNVNIALERLFTSLGNN
jgi:hypothetical protein